MEVALLGTGTMGTGMAHAMLLAGVDVRVWNRNPDRAAPLAEDGATVAPTPDAAVRGADVVITMLYDADSVLDVVGGISDAFPTDGVWLQSATVGLAGMARVAQLADEQRLHVLDAPVLGTKQPAEKGQLIVLASGDPALRDRAQPVLDAIGSRTVWAGDELGRASALKLAVNAWIATITAGVAQSLALAEALGLDAELFLQTIAGSPTDTPYAQLKGAQMIGAEFDPAFALDGVIKDLGLIRTAARDAGVADGVLDAVERAFRRAGDAGYGAQDMAAVITAFRPAD